MLQNQAFCYTNLQERIRTLYDNMASPLEINLIVSTPNVMQLSLFLTLAWQNPACLSLTLCHSVAATLLLCRAGKKHPVMAAGLTGNSWQ